MTPKTYHESQPDKSLKRIKQHCPKCSQHEEASLRAPGWDLSHFWVSAWWKHQKILKYLAPGASCADSGFSPFLGEASSNTGAGENLHAPAPRKNRTAIFPNW